ncbi:putative 4-hydroxy-2-oxoglutarate aldolase [Colletotrichum sp. SAR 10_70]|uniref:putative 4-hydroxy-2-oxoglutarate aldolase n=1 Tax=Colletotrichum siamense TaxID=690259 RepID=UPI001872E7BC|nr:putative 4-hydroxy-2-oxoglutarate aldolase [Colletotrichum siamense]KAF4826725.1 putative 4-hydroxy-2-oxoglutarate aldolase [Colletotrichum tropicale]KAI8168920.1 putative 4-hydroxy-2-oxoglutarate aldolase [Colletotrichum sp. SAR 10_71]KAI8199889.1 putative 4-hydroxy-2-oxoglutarate aldolase [Colletotrichum sp. SAR 10_70]KAI8214805.1 putative 4-hydroxy-2-oxoglutarate aldolase [Colletotrichum sp. SAR 10_76]KAI8230771.1 putative 4-hydroxy-2-oxoglutarate aldolase [Colletotrichum sp. SAR 10_86]
MSPSKVPPNGVWAPAVTLFNPETDELDLEAQTKYYSYLSKTGLAGLVILGTNAEAFLLTREERKALIATARKATGPDFPIMAGCGAHSTKQVLELLSDAAEAGANSALVLPPAYFGKQTTPAVIDRFFDEVATKSPIPIVIYNFPIVCNGIDLDSATIAKYAKKYDSIVGVKLTCGAVAKIVRLSAELAPEKFATYGGQSDFLLGGLTVGSAGCIAAFANVFPRVTTHIYKLHNEGKTAEALALHQKAALAEQATKAGIATIKYAASVFTAPRAGLAGQEKLFDPRRPYLPASEDQKKAVHSLMSELNKLEEELGASS